MSIAFSTFVRRQTKDSSFSHFEITEEEVLRRVHANYHLADPGYRDGVVLIPISPEGFFSSTVRLESGDRLNGIYEPRTAGERPRKQMTVIGRQKAPGKNVQIVLYRADVLAENNERSTDADWEIISINVSPTEDPEPMPVETLLYNYFHVAGSNDGGTNTFMSDRAFIEALQRSFLFWREHTRCQF